MSLATYFSEIPIHYFDFNYSFVVQQPFHVSAYTSLMLSFLLAYFVKPLYLRVIPFILALLFAWYGFQINFIALAMILVYGLTAYFTFLGKKKFVRQICFFLLCLLSISLMFFRLPGFFAWPVLQNAHLSANAVPYSMSFSFSKVLVGLFFVWFSQQSLAFSGSWRQTMKTALMVGFLAMVSLMLLSYVLGFVTLDLKWSDLFFVWALRNLFFVCFAEEALFRGIIQEWLLLKCQHWRAGKWLATLIAAMLFGLAHYPGGMRYMLLATVAGVFYGYAYQKTRKIETSVLVHFFVNSGHFLVMTYPALS